MGPRTRAGAAAVRDAPVARRLERDPRTRLAFTDRAFGNLSRVVGDGPVDDARARLAGLVGGEPGDAVFMEQVHGPGVARVGAADRGRGLSGRAGAVAGVDALVTTDAGVALVVLVADCVPLLLAAPGRGVAAVHAGRAGVAAGVVGAAVGALAGTAGAAPRRLAAWIGPAIGGCCYEVPRALALQVTAVAPAARATTTWGTPSLDLPAAVAAQLRAAGVVEVEQVGGCARCDHQRWFSHRATTRPPADAPGAPAGRQAGVIRMGAAPPLSPDEAYLD